MQKKILEYIYHLSINRSKQLFIFMIILTLLFGFFIVGGLFSPKLPVLRISSSRADLIPKTDPVQAKYLKYMEEFGAADNLIVVLEGETADLKKVIEDVAKEIGEEKKWVKSIFYKADTSAVIKYAPMFVPVDKLNEGLGIVKKHQGEINRISGVNNLYSMFGMMMGLSSNPELAARPDLAPALISSFSAFIEEWSSWIKDPKKESHTLMDRVIPKGSEIESVVKSDGYLFSKDFKMMFLFVQPMSSDDEMTYLKPFVGNIKKAVAAGISKNPGMADKVKAAYTGMPAHTLSETETLYSDVSLDGTLAIIFVAIVLLVGFRSFRKMIIAVIPILSGLIITLGIISISIGRLNLISSAMLAVLFGIGIDFGIYLIQRTEEELGNGLTLELAAYRSVVETSQSIITGGLTTSLAFFAISFSNFVGYSELGVTAGVGILVMLFTTFMFLPALILIIKVEPKKYDVDGIISASNTIRKRKPLVAISVIAALITGFSVFSLFNIKMDYDFIKLLPRNTESTIYQQKMEESSDYRMAFAAVTATCMEDLNKKTDKIKKLSTVGKVNSMADLIPDRQEEKIKIIRQYRQYLGGVNLAYIPVNRSAYEYSQLIAGMTEFFENYQEKAFAAGMRDLEDKLDKLIESLNSLSEEFSGEKGAEAVMRTTAFERDLFSKFAMVNGLVRSWLDPQLVTEKSYPPEVISNFKSAKGTYRALVSPNGAIWDIDFLDKFVKQIQEITDDVTGFPVTHRIYIRLAASAITESVIYSALMVIILLWVEFRSFKTVGLAFIPLMLGLLWMQAVMYVIKLPYNVASIAALPLLFGLGVVYGVRIVHRWLERPADTAFIATRTTGKGVFFAASATLIALFSIIFARHYGMSSFGLTLFIGLSICLIAALFVLPVIIDLLYLKKGDK